MNGTGNTLISGAIVNGSLVKQDSGTLTLTGTNTYGGSTAVNGGTLLVDSTSRHRIRIGQQRWHYPWWNRHSRRDKRGSRGGTNIAPGNGGNSTGILTTSGPLTLASNSNFRVDINGTAPGSDITKSPRR